MGVERIAATFIPKFLKHLDTTCLNGLQHRRNFNLYLLTTETANNFTKDYVAI